MRRISHLVTICFLLIAISFQCAYAIVVPTKVSSGDYKGSDGTTAHWQINAAHVLLWNNKPYAPVGGVFQPRSWSDGILAGDDHWNQDVADLIQLKAHGITSLLLTAGYSHNGTIPITSVPASRVQRTLDYLDQHGFTYGLDINAFPDSSVDCVVINPATYRRVNPIGGSNVVFRPIEGLKAAKYFLVSSHDSSILSSGDSDCSNGTDAVIPLDPGLGGDSTVMLTYPTVSYSQNTIEGNHCPDIWSQADSVRDDLLNYLAGLHFGNGLRFFVDPVRDDLGFYGAFATGVIPDSESYRTQFEAWLRQKYSSRLSIMEAAWAVKNEDLPDFATCTRSIPLWLGTRGISAIYDPKTNKTFDIYGARSAAWDDIRSFQSDSVQSVMNGYADALKKAVANVPVIYRWSQSGSLTLNKQTTGFDGILVETAQHGQELVTQAAGYALSDAEHSHRTTWLTGSVAPPGTAPSSTPTDRPNLIGYGTEQNLDSDADTLVDIGVKGMFVDALHRSESADQVNLLDCPTKQLDWLAGTSTKFSSACNIAAPKQPSILYFPTRLLIPGLRIKKLDDGSWWLPADFDSEKLGLGSDLEGYTIPSEVNDLKTYVLFSDSKTPKAVSFKFDAKDKPAVTSRTSVPVKVSSKQGNFKFVVGQNPVLLTGISSLPLPDDAIAEISEEIGSLLEYGHKIGASIDPWTQRLYYIQQNRPLKNSAEGNETGYMLLTDFKNQLSAFVSPFTWIEAEQARSESFSSIIFSNDVSDGSYLWLDTNTPPDSGVYSAEYPIAVNSPGDYDVWASIAPAKPIGMSDDTSDFTIRFDSGTELTPDRDYSVGDQYGSLSRSGSRISARFAWFRLVTVHLTAGEHKMVISVPSPAKATGRWTLGIDAFCLSRGDFHPNGIQKPTP